MRPQYIAGSARSRAKVEALSPHTRAFAYAACAFWGNSVMVPSGCTQVTHTSEPGQLVRMALQPPVTLDRRHITCRTASRASWPSAWSHSLPLVHSKPKKSSWSLSQSPSAKSRSTPVSTSNPHAVYTGQAVRPVPTAKARPEPLIRTKGTIRRTPSWGLQLSLARKARRYDPAFPISRSAAGGVSTRALRCVWGAADAGRAAGAGAPC